MKTAKFFKIKNKVLITWLLSYVLVLAIPLLIGSLLYAEAGKIIEDVVNQVHQTSLEQVRATLDSSLSDIRKIGSALAVDSIVKKLTFKWGNLAPTDFYDMYVLQSSLISLKATNSTIDSVYIYFKRNGSILSQQQRIDSQKYSDQIIGDFQMTTADWIAMTGPITRETYRIITLNNADGTTSKKIVYMKPVQLISFSSSAAVIVMLIDGVFYENALAKASGNSQTTVTLVDTDNNFLSSQQSSDLPGFMSYAELKASSPLFKINFSGKELTVIQDESSINSWKLVSAIPTDIYRAKVEYIRLILVIYIVAVLIIGLSITAYVVNRNYKPLKKLTQLANQGSASDKQSETNEYKYIEQIMRGLQDEKNSLNDRLELQKSALRESFLGRLMKGSISNSRMIVESCKMHDIKPIGDEFAVMIYHLESIGENFSADDPKDAQLVNFILKTAIEELTNELHLGWVAEVDGRICSIVSIRKGCEAAARQDIKTIADKTVGFIEANFGIIATLAVSDVHQTTAGIARAYTEAMEVIEYITIIDDFEPVMLYDTVFQSSRPGREESVMFNKERRFTDLIIKKDFNEAAKIMDEILVHDIFKSAPSLQVVKYRVFGLLNIMLNAIGEIRTSLETDLFDDSDILERLIATTSIRELREQIGDIFATIGQHYAQANITDTSEKFDSIIAHIDENFTDPNLTVSSISYLFDINISYLSRMFKKSKGIGMLDYIHQLRIAMAKQLLQKTDLSIREIADKTGYTNDIGIIRAFKRYEGTTPGKFRDSTS